MKKAFQFCGLLLASVLILGIGSGRVFARLTGTDPGNDVHCLGISGAEVCLDVSGNLIPTTDNDTTLGTTTYRWATVNAYDLAAADDLTVADDATVTDDLTVGGDLFHTPIATQAVTAAATINLTGACNGLVRLSATADVTTNTTDTFTAPTAANIGCVYYIVNTGGGIITLDDNAHFDVPANVPLGTNDGAIIVQGGSSYILLGTSDN